MPNSNHLPAVKLMVCKIAESFVTLMVSTLLYTLF
nr:MAG TPA: hypothetical protein [Bacteriophage sp.]